MSRGRRTLMWTTVLSAMPLIVDLGELGAQPPQGEERQALIVLLTDVDPGAEEIARAINERLPAIPAGLEEGNPERARPAISSRARGLTREWVRNHPDEPFSLLQNYIRIEYPSQVNLSAVARALRNNPRVRNVEVPFPFTLHSVSSAGPPAVKAATVEPIDGAFPLQWHLELLRFRYAWPNVVGHIYAGLIDQGLSTNHFELRESHDVNGVPVYDGGNFRPHLSRDFAHETAQRKDCNVDELDPDNLDPGEPNENTRAGHGTHVSSLLAANTDNDSSPASVSGGCWNCSLLMAQAFPAGSTQTEMDRAGNSLNFLIEQGVQVVSMSFGVGPLFGVPEDPCNNGSGLVLDFFCAALALADQRGIFMVASSGNDKRNVEFPGNDGRVVAVGGVEEGGEVWDEDDEPGELGCPCTRLNYGICSFVPTFECGTNRGPTQELAGPAPRIVGSTYEGFDHNPDLGCGDKVDGTVDGRGPCTGTSMASPLVASVAGLVETVCPLLSKAASRDILTSTASQAGNRDDLRGYGYPDAEKAVKRALGEVAGEPVTNRLTPLLGFYSTLAQAHVYTVFPSSATAFLFDVDEPFHSEGLPVPGYSAFPMASSCPAPPCNPRASDFVFTTRTPPFPGAPALVPLHRLRYDPNLPFRCATVPPNRIHNRDFAFATSDSGILDFRENVVDRNGQPTPYFKDGLEGYVYQDCSPYPECRPPGTERLYQAYNELRTDYAVFLERDKASMEVQGYNKRTTVLGLAYPLQDSDGDRLIDGYELLIGTDPNNADSDCDGFSDGDEVQVYDLADPSETPSFGDPQNGPCATGPLIFENGFESGDTSRWSSTQS